MVSNINKNQNILESAISVHHNNNRTADKFIHNCAILMLSDKHTVSIKLQLDFFFTACKMPFISDFRVIVHTYKNNFVT